MLPEIRYYYFKRDLITNLLSQFSEEEMKVQIKGLNNCVYWLIGHLTSSRLSMLNLSLKLHTRKMTHMANQVS